MENRKGFTLLEILIVIVIIGILAAVALPRFAKTIEYSRSAEAMTQLSSLRQSMERYYTFKSQYSFATLTSLDYDPTSLSGSSHFTFANPSIGAGGDAYSIMAYRLTVDGGAIADFIFIKNDGGKGGSGAFLGIR